MAALPFVSIVIPCRNEERFIAACLDSIIANDYPKERLEILVVDGMSVDRTQQILATYESRYPFLKVLENPKKIIPAAMNTGIRNAGGEIIIKIDAHSVYSPDYISNCVKFQAKYDADNVGGVIVTRPSYNSLIAKAIATALGDPFGSGNSHFRVGSREPRWADTVAFGCYRAEVFRRVGLYNEELVRSSDMDLNTRLRRAGGKILLVPDIVAYYYPSSTFTDFLVRNISDGFWALYPLKFGSCGVRTRHLIPLVSFIAFITLFVVAMFFQPFWWILLLLFGGYLVITVAVSSHAAARQREPLLVGVLPIIFGVRHLAYAVGSTWGALLVLPSRTFWTRKDRGQ